MILMKAFKRGKQPNCNLIALLTRALIVAVFLLALPPTIRAVGYAPGPDGPHSRPTFIPLDSWSFDYIGWTSDKSYPPISYTNLAFVQLGNGSSLVVNSTVPAWLQYNVYETNGATNLTVDVGTVMFWFAPAWSSVNAGGTGPGEYGRLLEVGGYTPDSSYGLWSLYVDPAGTNIYFSTQTNDISSNITTYVSAPISWTTNYFHFVVLTYSATNTALYLDGVLASSGPAITNYPGTDVLTNGFFVGSDSNGIYQAQGLFNSLATYNVPLDADTIQGTFNEYYGLYLMNPWNIAMFTILSADSSQTTYSPFGDVITGAGFLHANHAVAVHNYGTNAYQVWMTNVTAAAVSNGTTAISFDIEGGTNGYMYDVFATGALVSPLTNGNWFWLGQGGSFTNYTVNITSQNSFLILGTPLDSDLDGLTDAYELLVSHSNPTNYSTDASGMADGWEVLYFKHTGIDPNADPDGDGLSNYQEFQMYSQGYSPIKWNSSTNTVVGDGYLNFSGDGLANLLQASFGGSMMTNNLAWRANISGDGLPDEYKTMAGLSPGSATTAPGLPAFSKNPIQ